MKRHVLVIGDSLTYHGPDRPHVLTDPRLWPNVMAERVADRVAARVGAPRAAAGAPAPLLVGDAVEVDLVARLGWTARDAWWAVTKDPALWGRVLPRADALVLAVGGMDQLAAAIPTYLRDGIPYVRPAKVRRRVRNAYRQISPHVIRLTGGRMRQLPQAATDHYLARITSVVRHFNPDLPVVLVGPGVHHSPAYPSQRPHAGAVRAARAWVLDNGAGYVEIDDLILPSLLDGSANPDGIHYSWRAHELIGAAVGDALLAQGFGTGAARASRPDADLDTAAIGL